MHPYELQGRRRIEFSLAVLSVLLVWLTHTGLSTFSFELPWWLSAPSVAGFYCGLYWVFDRHVWTVPVLRTVGLVGVPDLNGKWDGIIKSSYDKAGSAHSVSVFIRQRWSKISIRLETEHSRSQSVMASLKTGDVPQPELAYLYVNEPKAMSQGTMNMHRGTAILELNGGALEGEYYTGRGRREFGTISLCRA